MLTLVVDFVGRGMSAGRIRAAALGVLALLTAQCSAFSAERLTVRDDLVAPRDIFFSDYFLFSAQADVMTMSTGEHVALGRLLDTCADTLSAAESLRLRCEMARQQYLMDYRRDRLVDRLLDTVQFMTSMIRYNLTIGRQNEAGLNVRQETIDLRLREAIRVVLPIKAGAESKGSE